VYGHDAADPVDVELVDGIWTEAGDRVFAPFQG
jgi:hypothetical protein